MNRQQEINTFRHEILPKYELPIMERLELEEAYNKTVYLEEKMLSENLNIKRCKTCGKIKPLEEFYKNVIKKQKVFDECKTCVKARSKSQRILNKILSASNALLT